MQLRRVGLVTNPYIDEKKLHDDSPIDILWAAGRAVADVLAGSAAAGHGQTETCPGAPGP